METAYSIAVRKLAREFDLPPPDEFAQDWAHEVPLSLRTVAQLRRYLSPTSEPRPIEERGLLMTLTLNAANTLAAEGKLTSEDWGRVERELASDPGYTELIDYWADRGTPVEDSFAIASRMRRLRKSLIREKR